MCRDTRLDKAFDHRRNRWCSPIVENRQWYEYKEIDAGRYADGERYHADGLISPSQRAKQ